MKVVVLQEDLLKALNSVSRFVSSRAQLPVLANILLTAEAGKLRLTATNLEMGISWSIGAKVETEGAISVPGKVIVELIANLSAGQVVLSLDHEKLHIKTQSLSAQIGGILASEFPQVPASAEKKDFVLGRDVLCEITKQVVFAAAEDETRPVLTGVLLIFAQNKVRAVATDGFRLSCKDIFFATVGEEKKILLPARVLDELIRVLPEKDKEVDVSMLEREKRIIFSCDSFVLTGRVLEGQFPDFEKIIPKKYSLRAQAAKDDLLRAVKASAVFAREAASVIRLKFETDKIIVSAESQQYGQEQYLIDAKIDGGDLQVAFNYKFVLDFLNSIEGREVQFESDGAMAPGVFRNGADASLTHLIMPVRLQS